MYLTVSLVFLFILLFWIIIKVDKPKIFFNPNGNVSSLVNRMKTIKEMYLSTPWLFTSNMHTIYGMRFRKSSKMQPKRETIDFPDGGCAILDWFMPKSYSDKTPIVIICHTLGGGTREACVNNMAEKCVRKGWASVVANSRGCSGAPLTSSRIYNCYEADDLQFIVSYIKKTRSPSDIFIIGFSMGAYLTAQFSFIDGSVSGTCCVSHTYDAHRAGKILEDGRGDLYLPFILSKIKHQLKKNDHIPEAHKEQALLSKTLREFDDCFTAPYLGMKDSREYYAHTAIHSKISEIKCPMMMIGADDDPFTGKELMPIKEVTESKNVIFVETKTGGHVSFLTGLLGKNSFVEKVALEWFEAIANK